MMAEEYIAVLTDTISTDIVQTTAHMSNEREKERIKSNR
uniref:Uncharacterized protein n=1 Tax=Arundo donax TaxID=35708 RepID=A0A0A9FYN6_ARUDO